MWSYNNERFISALSSGTINNQVSWVILIKMIIMNSITLADHWHTTTTVPISVMIRVFTNGLGN